MPTTASRVTSLPLSRGSASVDAVFPLAATGKRDGARLGGRCLRETALQKGGNRVTRRDRAGRDRGLRPDDRSLSIVPPPSVESALASTGTPSAEVHPSAGSARASPRGPLAS